MRPQISCRTWTCRCPRICAQNDIGSSQSGVYPEPEAANLGLCSRCRCGGSRVVEGCDLVAQVQYTVALKRSSQSQLALLGSQVIEEPSTMAQEKRNEMDGEFVDQSDLRQRLGGGCAVHHHVAATSGALSLRDGPIRNL